MDRVHNHKAQPKSETNPNENWLVSNVANPFLNSLALEPLKAIEDASNAASKQLTGKEWLPQVELQKVNKEVKSWSAEFFAQNIASGLAMVVPYGLAGRVTAGGLRLICKTNLLRSGTQAVVKSQKIREIGARIIASNKTGQILGAGIYDFAKEPEREADAKGKAVPTTGEHATAKERLANGGAGAASFAVYEAMNPLLHKTGVVGRFLEQSGIAKKLAVKAAGLFTIGATGSAVGSAARTGINEGRVIRPEEMQEGVLSGGVMNILLPTVQHGIGKSINHLNVKLGRGVPIQSYVSDNNIDLKSLPSLKEDVNKNAFSRVQPIEELLHSVNVPSELIKLGKGATAKDLAHELAHLAQRTDKNRNAVFAKLRQRLQDLEQIKSRNTDARSQTIEQQHESIEQDFMEQRIKDEVKARLIEQHIVRELNRGKNDDNTELTQEKLYEQIKHDHLYQQLFEKQYDDFAESNGKQLPCEDYSLRALIEKNDLDGAIKFLNPKMPKLEADLLSECVDNMILPRGCNSRIEMLLGLKQSAWKQALESSWYFIDPHYTPRPDTLLKDSVDRVDKIFDYDMYPTGEKIDTCRIDLLSLRHDAKNNINRAFDELTDNTKHLLPEYDRVQGQMTKMVKKLERLYDDELHYLYTDWADWHAQYDSYRTVIPGELRRFEGEFPEIKESTWNEWARMSSQRERLAAKCARKQQQIFEEYYKTHIEKILNVLEDLAQLHPRKREENPTLELSQSLGFFEPTTANGLLYTAKVFGNKTADWISKNYALNRTAHDACYWLKIAAGRKFDGRLADFLLSNCARKTSELEIIANNWHALTASERQLPYSELLLLLKSKTYPGAKHTGFAGESATWGIDRLSYRKYEDRFLESQAVPEAFDCRQSFLANELMGKFLPRSDVRGLFLGQYTNCCQHPDGQGKACAWYGQESPNSGFFVVENKQGEIIAQSWVWRSDDGSVCFDNVETLALGSRANAVIDIYQQAANYLSKEHPIVTMGEWSDLKTSRWKSAGGRKLRHPVDFSGYTADSERQVILAENK